MYGCILSPDDPRDYKAKDYIVKGARPAAFVQAPAPILYQGGISSCVAHALATLKYIQERKERASYTQYSTDYIYHNRLATDYQGVGMVVREALSQLCKYGTCRRAELPTNTEYPNAAAKSRIVELLDSAKEQKIKSYIRCETIDDICDCIYQNGAAILSIMVKASFKNFWFKELETYILPMPQDGEKDMGYHCITAIGYNDQGLIIQNSWGDNWGYDGTAILPYNYPIAEAWGVTDIVCEWDKIELPINKNYAVVNGAKKALDVPAQIKDGRTLVPIRFIAEQLGAEVEFLEDTQTVVIRRRRNNV